MVCFFSVNFSMHACAENLIVASVNGRSFDVENIVTVVSILSDVANVIFEQS